MQGKIVKRGRELSLHVRSSKTAAFRRLPFCIAGSRSATTCNTGKSFPYLMKNKLKNRKPGAKSYSAYPIGFFDCQAQVSRHMSSSEYCARQPSSCALLSGLEYTVARSPGRRGAIS